VVIDKPSADDGKIAIGDTITITPTSVAPREFTVVGIVRFASVSSFGGPTWALFDLTTAQEFVLDQPGVVSAIAVVADDGVSQTELQQRIQAQFDPTEVEALTGQQIIEESQSSLARQFSFFTTFLTVFALISIFVGSFVIYNVFKISAAQRMRENALMRAIGARASQVTFSLFVEAFVIGVIGAVLGFVGGVGLAVLITTLLDL
ncbi:MAG TPA: ABC transporter permease, partial [Ilumatobacteraceae bacterium]|nr:ABC transporter permease [Ilumatobacteraceae bacterium]